MAQRETLEVESGRATGIISYTKEMYLTGSKERSGGKLSFEAANKDNENGGKFLEFYFKWLPERFEEHIYEIQCSSYGWLEAIIPSDVRLRQLEDNSQSTFLWQVKRLRGNLFYIASDADDSLFLSAKNKNGDEGPGLVKWGEPRRDDHLLWILNVFTSEDKKAEEDESFSIDDRAEEDDNDN